MKYYTLFQFLSVIVFILLVVARAVHPIDREDDAKKPFSTRNIVVYVSCALSMLCYALLNLSIRRNENVYIVPMSMYTTFAFILCATSSMALGNVSIFEKGSSYDIDIREMLKPDADLPRITCVILINFLVIMCIRRLIVIKYDSEYASRSRREFVPEKIAARKIYAL